MINQRRPSAAQRRELLALLAAGKAVRVWSSNREHDWHWRIEGELALTLESCIRFGWAKPAGERVTITDAGRSALERDVAHSERRAYSFSPARRSRGAERAVYQPDHVQRPCDRVRQGAHGVSLAISAAIGSRAGSV